MSPLSPSFRSSARRVSARYGIGHRLRAGLAYVLVLLSCGDPLSPDDTSVARIAVSPSTLALTVGGVSTIAATAIDASGDPISGARAFWSVENPLVATVSQQGLVTGVAPGSTRVAVSIRGTSAIIPVTVSPRSVSLVRVTPPSATLRVGANVALQADAQNSAGEPVPGRPVDWRSGNEAVATVSAAGIVTGIAPGIATISATIDGVVGSALVTIEAIPVASVRVSPETGTLLVGQTLQLSATPVDSSGAPLAGRTTSWGSSAPAVASVSSAGVVSALAPGSATITATTEGRSGTARLTVSLVPVDAIIITPSAATTTIGRTVQLSARTLDAGGAELFGRSVTWSSDRTDIATVASDGTMTAVAEGRAVITATAEGKSGRAIIDVTPFPVASLTMAPTTLALTVGSSQQLTATPRDPQGGALSGRVVTWLSGAPSVATVDQNGVVTAIGVGTALIIATCEGQRATATLTTSLALVASVTVSPLAASLNPDSSVLFTSTARDANGNVLTGRGVRWTSSNSAVATVSVSGLVTGMTVGSARITATTDGITATGTVTVSLVPVARITLSPNPVTVVEGQLQAVTATVADSNGAPLVGRALVWASNNAAVATVSPTGIVTAVAPGTATISASAPNAGVGGTTPSGSGSVVVSFAPVAAVSIVPAAPTITVGTPAQLTATLTGAAPATTLSPTGRTLTWSVADPSIATIAATGVVTGIRPGITTVTLTAASPGQATPASTTVTLTVSLVPAARIDIAPVSGAIHVGTLYSRPLSAQVFDASNNLLVGRTITWSTSDPARLTAAPAPSAPGAATLTALGAPATGLLVIASVQGATGVVSDTLTIDSDLVPVASVSVSPTAATLTPQQTRALVATASDSAGNVIGTSGGDPLGGRIARWSSANAAVGTVSSAGVVTAVGVGSTSISASLGSAAPAVFALTVVPVPVATVSVSAPASTLILGNTMQATVVARDAAGNVLTLGGRSVVWTSGSTTIVSVSSSGLVSAVGVGNTVVSVTVDGVGPATVAVSVTSPVIVPAPVVSVSASLPDSSLTIGVAVQATVVARDSTGAILSLAGRTVVWSSSATGVATVSTSGVVTAVGVGGTFLRVTVDGIGPASVPLTVSLVPVATVSVVAPDSSLTPGSVVQGTVVARDAANTVLSLAGRTVAWSSSATGVATVSASGLITAVGPGSTTIGVTVDGVGPATFTLSVAPTPVASVSATAPDSSLTTGTVVQGTVVARDGAGNALPLAGRTVVWSSSATGVATVSAAGVISAVAPGTATIAVTVDGVGPATIPLSVTAVSVASVSVTAPDSSVTPGTVVQGTVVARDGAGNALALAGRNVIWSSSVAGVATVSASGLITAVSPGSTTIGVTVDGVGPATFTLSVAPTPVASVSATAPDSSLTTGTVVQGTVVARDGAGNSLPLAGRTVVWSSSATNVATVSAAGVISAVAPGPATIAVTVDGVGPATIPLSVTAVPVASVSVTATDSSVTPGTVVQGTVVARDGAGNALALAGRNVIWSSSVAGVATVSASGLITAVSPGSTTIGVTVDGVGPATFTLSVAPTPVASVSATAPDSSLTTGTVVQGTVVARDGAGNSLPLAGRTVVWSSSATNVATVSAAGVISAVAPGPATIAVTVDGVGPATIPLVVSAVPVASVSVSAPDSSVTPGTVVQGTVVARDGAGNALALAGRTVVWSSSTTNVATVSASGLITAVGPGTTTIGVTVDGVGPATFALTVAPTPVASVSATAPDSSLTTGTVVQGTVVARDGAGNTLTLTGRAIVWSSSVTSVATVSSSGLITAVGPGSTTIGVTVDGVGPATIPLTVAPASVASVSVTAPDSSLTTGTAVQATVVARDAANNILPLTGRTVVWSSSVTSVATVSVAGVISAVAPGTTTIGVTVDGVGPATIPLVVSAVPVASVSVTAPDSSLTPGAVIQATVEARDAASNVLPLVGRTVVWTSSTASAATVSATGLITAVGSGTTTIGVTVDGVGPATFTLSVAPTPVASVSVTAPDSSLTVGASVQGTVVARDAASNILSLVGRTVAWSSSASGIATVSASGTITAVAPGSATIGVTVDGVGPATIPLSVAPAPVASVSVTAPDSSLTVGDVVQATVVARDAANNILPLAGRSVVWSSSVTSVATVLASGLITAVAPGNTTIGVTVDGVGPATIPLIVSAVPVASVSVTAPDSSLTTGTAVQAAVVARDAAGSVLSLVGRSVAWSSSATGVATVSASGLITAVASGSATIGVTVDGVGPATIPLTVSAVPVASVSVTAPDSSLTTGTAVQATVVARDAASNILSMVGRTVAWSSSASGIATVSASGTITAVAPGSATIGVTVDGVGPATIPLTVAPAPVASVSVTAPDSSLTVGDVVQATVVARDAANNILPLTGRTVVWSSSVTSVATVSAAGLISAVAPGSTSIRVTVDGVGPATIALTVSPVPVASVSVTAPDSSLMVGDVVQATVVARDAAGNALLLAGRTIAWSSSATSVASVSATGVITAVGAGNATIGVTVDGVGPATIPVTVVLVPVASVSVAPATPSLLVGATVTVVATPRDSAGNPLTNRSIAWSLGNAKASISTASGSTTILTARDSGVVILTATSGGKTGTSTATIALVPVDTVLSMPASAAPSVSLRAGAGRSSTEGFRAISNSAGALPGRAFSVSVSNSTLATAVAAGSTVTDSRGRGDFVVTLTAAARAGDAFTVTVTIEGKSTVWQVRVR